MRYLILILMLVMSVSAADRGSVAQGNFKDFGKTPTDIPTVEDHRALQRRVRQLEAGALTTYDVNGFPTGQQTEDNKGRHRVSGTVKLVTSVAQVSLNSIASIDQQDVSFRDSSSYSGNATPIVYNANTYQVITNNGFAFTIVSSLFGDTTTVRWVVEGE